MEFEWLEWLAGNLCRNLILSREAPDASKEPGLEFEWLEWLAGNLCRNLILSREAPDTSKD